MVLNLLMNKFKSLLPILQWLPQYNTHWLKSDINAGLTVGIMLIPQTMAHASLAGMPAQYGLYTAFIPAIIYALLGTCRQMSTASVAMVAMLTGSALGSLNIDSLGQYIQYAFVLSFLIGIIQLLFGILRLGFLVDYFSRSVIVGFTSALAIIIAFTQLKYFFGIAIERSNSIVIISKNLWQNIDQTNGVAMALGIVAILIIVGARKISYKIPGQLLAVVFGITMVYAFHLAEGKNALNIVKDIPNALPHFQWINLDWEIVQKLLPMALMIAIISFISSIATAKIIQAEHSKEYQLDSNQELIAFGVANIVGAFFQSYPTAGGFSRSAVNDQAGAKTGVASLVSASLIIITLLFLTHLFYFLPKTILASIILVAVFKLIAFAEFKHFWQNNKLDFTLLFITFIITLLLGVEWGLGLGLFLSLGRKLILRLK